MKVQWYKGSKVNEGRTVLLKGSEILDTMHWQEQDGLLFLSVEKDGTSILLPLKRLIAPLGDLGRVLVLRQDIKGLKDVLSRYWLAKGKDPQFQADFVNLDGDLLQLRVKQVVSKSQVFDRFLECLNRSSLQYDEVVIGSDSKEAEFQFLWNENTNEVKKGDLIKPGIFVHLNGGMKVSAGVHRVVCTNGLLDRMYVWSSQDPFIREEMFERASKVVSWLSNQIGKKITSPRELSVFCEGLPKYVVNKLYKSWVEKLPDLDWYDVINDVTQEANARVSLVRYRLIGIVHKVSKIQEEGQCPVCGTRIR